MTTIRLAISTCPNDTFAFHALMHQLVDWRGLQFVTELLDISELNSRLGTGGADVIKTSFFAALPMADQMIVLPSGSALGFGVGPLLLASAADVRPEHAGQLTLCPGETTTATFLFRTFFPGTTRIEQTLFSEIMPRLQRGSAEFGVCIHEGRFTWESSGLSKVADLGELWEQATRCPLPLGGILARRDLGTAILQDVQRVVYDSLRFALANPVSALPTMRQYAQEFDDDVLMQHVELYVNDWTLDLGDMGRRGLDALAERARAAGLMAESAAALEILGCR